MHTLIRRACWVALLCSLIFVPGMAQADIFMQEKHHTDAFQMMGQAQPAKDTLQSIWITKDCMRNDSADSSVLVRLDKQRIYLIDHVQKTYGELPLNFEKAMQEMGVAKMPKEQQQAMAQMMKQMMKVSITVTETPEQKKIKTWNCRKYIQKMNTAMGPVTTEVWATQDLKTDYDLFAKYQAVMMSLQPGLRDALSQVMKEARKIKGVTVQTKTTSTMMGTTMKSSTELMEYKEGKAPATINGIPAGYKKQSMK